MHAEAHPRLLDGLRRVFVFTKRDHHRVRKFNTSFTGQKNFLFRALILKRISRIFVFVAR